MATAMVIGAQWGDEGKGKIVDYLAAKADVVVRSQGGNNAGHTVVTGGQAYPLRLMPSGIMYNSLIISDWMKRKKLARETVKQVQLRTVSDLAMQIRLTASVFAFAI